jgi:copper resistance protein C
MIIRIASIGIAAVLTIGVVDQASAHAHLKTATPAANGTVTAAPAELDLSFSEGVNLKFTGVKVTGPGGTEVPTGEAKLASGGDTTLVVPVTGTLVPGSYKVDWHALATDGHKTEGSYSFTIKP